MDFNFNQQILFDHFVYIVKKLDLQITHNKMVQMYRAHKKGKTYLNYDDVMELVEEINQLLEEQARYVDENSTDFV